MKKKALITIAEGFEEIEAITVIDILRRAEIVVTVASLKSDRLVEGRSEIVIEADTDLHIALEQDYDIIILPGGGLGTKNLRESQHLIAALKKQNTAKKFIAAICAAPTVLLDAGVLKNKAYTAHYSVKKELPNILEDQKVVIDGNIITSQGPGTSIQFALAIVSTLLSESKSKEICKGICF